MGLRDGLKQLAAGLSTAEGTLAQKTVRGGFWVFFSFGLGRILGLVSSIVLARLLMPADFGLMGLVGVSMAAIATFTTTGIEPALIHGGEINNQVLNVAWTISVLRGILLWFTVFAGAPFIAAFFRTTALESLLRVVAFTFLAEGFVNVGLTILRKDMDFKTLAVFDLGVLAPSLVASIIAAVILRNVWTLVIGAIVQALVRLVASYLIHPFRPRLHWDWSLAKDLFGYGKHVIASGVVHYFLTQGDDALVGRVLGAAPLGFYGLAYRLSNMPATNLTHVVSQVMFPAYSQIQEDTVALRSAYLNTLRSVALIAVPLSAGLFVLAPEIIAVLYGDKWLAVVPAFMVLCFFGLERSIGASAGPLFLAVGKPHLVLYLTLAKLLVMGIAIYPLTLRYGILGTSIAVTLSAVVVAVSVLPTVARVLQCELTVVLGTLRTPFTGTLLMSISLFLLKHSLMGDGSPVSLMGLVSVGFLIYFLYLHLAEPELVRRAISFMGRVREG